MVVPRVFGFGQRSVSEGLGVGATPRAGQRILRFSVGSGPKFRGIAVGPCVQLGFLCCCARPASVFLYGHPGGQGQRVRR
eukprot:9926730-Lingulodinium_polyedra.AAC.1